MNIVIFSHPSFTNSSSMPRFASMICKGVRVKGHSVDVWSPAPIFYRLPLSAGFRKWCGYIDQYFIFPILVKIRLLITPSDTIFVFSDQALGPWVPLINNRPHVVHVHDFMALKSSIGEYAQNPTKSTGKMYQKFICWGFRHSKYFISVSERTNSDLQRFMNGRDYLSRVIYNGLNYEFKPINRGLAIKMLGSEGLSGVDDGYIVHVGGNQWYKNRLGVLRIYFSYRNRVKNPLPLVMVGERPARYLLDFVRDNGIESSVKFVSGLSNDLVAAVYSSASLLLFPSIAEGFGWPIIEAMSCGCPVLTTHDAPMTEIGREHASYIPIIPSNHDDIEEWALNSAKVIEDLLAAPSERKAANRQAMISYVRQFSADNALNAYLKFYEEILGVAI